LAAAKYADTSDIKAMALTAAAVTAYNQGRMELAEGYAQQACEARSDMADAHFQLARIRLNKRDCDGAWQAALQAITLDHRYAARLPLDSEFRRNADGINPAWREYAKKLREPLAAAAQIAGAAMRELAKSREELNCLKNSRAFKLLAGECGGLDQARSRFREMKKLIDILSPEAVRSLALLSESLQGNSVFAWLEATPYAQRAKDVTAGALAASREAELTLRKVEQLSTGLPDPSRFVPDAVRAALWENRRLILGGAVWCIVLTRAFVSLITQTHSVGGTHNSAILTVAIFVWILFVPVPVYVFAVYKIYPMAKKNALTHSIESFDWSAANAPQTTAAKDGVLYKADAAIKTTVGRAYPDRVDLAEVECRVIELMRRGQKVQAIKLYREQTGCDLVTGKNAVEALMGQRIGTSGLRNAR
jgi:ribosomal protein L7/L12